jgi:threonylcarbamoyladenosine tRNA methylthiotransferase MtaB
VSAEPLRVAIRTLGCKVNRTESEGLAESLLASGIAIVEEESSADLVIVNTCTVTGEADAKARKEVRRALAAAAGPVVVTGCLAAVDAASLRALDPRVVVEPDRTRLPLRVGSLLGIPALPSPEPAARLVPRAGAAFRTRVMVKIQDGCDRRCAYCIVPDARGLPRSEPATDLFARVTGLVNAGASEVVLTGINIGRYSDPESAIPDLGGLVRVLAGTGVPRLRISSIEPLDLTPVFVEAISAVGVVVPHLHVPLQSGCDRTLHAMGRGYVTADFASALARVREAVPGLAVTTDVIVGFPGETDADFSESLAFAEACAFAKLHVFRYSPRAGTPAADSGDQVPPAQKSARAESMRALSERLVRAHVAARAGTLAAVLVERSAEGAVVGTTEDGLHVLVDACDARPLEIVTVMLRTDADGVLRGRPMEAGRGAQTPTSRPRRG